MVVDIWVFTLLKLGDIKLKNRKPPIILPMGFVVHFVVDRLFFLKNSGILLFSVFKFDKMKKCKKGCAVDEALDQSNQDTTCNTSIEGKVKFVCGHTDVQL